MRSVFLFWSICFSSFLQADNMEHFMNIVNNIPKMEIKADAQAQAWARSARNVLFLTSETIAETLLQGNELMKAQGKPIFCLPQGVILEASLVESIIKQTYQELANNDNNKEKMTVSAVAWIGISKKYPCK